MGISPDVMADSVVGGIGVRLYDNDNVNVNDNEIVGVSSGVGVGVGVSRKYLYWSEEEHELCITAAEKFGWKDYRQIALQVGTRTRDQVTVYTANNNIHFT